MTIGRRGHRGIAVWGLLAVAMGAWVCSAVGVTDAAESTASGTPQANPMFLSGQQALDETVFPGLTTKISLDLRAMDLVEVLKFLATKGRLNIVTSPEIQGRATLTLTDVSVRDALDIVLVSNALAVERRGTILYIMSEAVYLALYGRKYTDPRKSFITQLVYANPGQVGTLLGTVKSPVGRVVIDEPTGTVSVLDVPEAVEEMRRLIDRVDIPSIQRQLPVTTQVFPLQFAKAEDVQMHIESSLTPEVGKLRVDKRSNSLVITELPAKLPEITQLIQAFDAKHRQVFIEATILQVTLKDHFDTGINWEWLSESGSGLADINIVNTAAIASDAASGAKVVVGSIVDDDATATLKALHEFGDTDVLSTPHIAVMNNQEAKILVGRREAYVTTTTTQAQTTATTAESIQFVDVGVKLYVTPVVSENGFITMKIRPEVSSVVSTLKTSTGNTIPIVETSEAETQVMVKDGSTIVIGGLMKDEATLTQQKIPLVGDLPLIGLLFGNRSDRIKKTELVILMSPHVISGEELFAPSATASVVWPAGHPDRRLQ